jgi:hypothetical protein
VSSPHDTAKVGSAQNDVNDRDGQPRASPGSKRHERRAAMMSGVRLSGEKGQSWLTTRRRRSDATWRPVAIPRGGPESSDEFVPDDWPRGEAPLSSRRLGERGLVQGSPAWAGWAPSPVHPHVVRTTLLAQPSSVGRCSRGIARGTHRVTSRPKIGPIALDGRRPNLRSRHGRGLLAWIRGSGGWNLGRRLRGRGDRARRGGVDESCTGRWSGDRYADRRASGHPRGLTRTAHRPPPANAQRCRPGRSPVVARAGQSVCDLGGATEPAFETTRPSSPPLTMDRQRGSLLQASSTC